MVTLYRNKKFEAYFGLFGPCLSFHTNVYPEDTNRIVISLILFKLYFSIPRKRNYNHFDQYAVYGFYSESDPDRLIFQWGDYHKMIVMPWGRVVVAKYLMRNDDTVEANPNNAKIISTEDILVCMKNNPDVYLNDSRTGKYAKAIVHTRPKIFKNIDWFTKHSYEIHVNLEKSFNGWEKFYFNTKHNIAIDSQIDLQLLMRDKNYTDF